MIEYCARHPTAANLLMVALVALGAVNLQKIRRETFPEYRPRQVRVSVPYPGATAVDVEDAIVQRIEDAIDGVPYVAEVRGDARANLGTVEIEMTGDGNYAAFKDKIDTAVGSITEFPERAEEATIEEMFDTDLVMRVLMAGPMSDGDLKIYAEKLKDRLREAGGTSLVTIVGFSDHQIRVELDEQALVRHNLSAADVVESIRDQSVETPAGILETDREDIVIRFNERRETVEGLEELVVVRRRDGSSLRVRDLGNVVDAFERDENKVVMYRDWRLDDRAAANTSANIPIRPQRAALLEIRKTQQQDALAVAAAVKKFLKDERKRHPQVTLIVTQNRSRLIDDRLGLLLTNGWQGMLLVFAMMWLFFSIRLSFWVTLSLPVSFAGALFFLPPLDLTINMLTAVGLLLAIGILMDDGIVIAENVARRFEAGEDPIDAAVRGTREVAGGVFSSFTTTLCVLGPLMFLAGNIGRTLEVVPMVLLLVLAVSLVEAFLILPRHLGRALEHIQTKRDGHDHRAKSDSRLRERIDRGFDWTRDRILGRSVDLLTSWRYLSLGVTLMFFLIAVAIPAGGWLKFQALPEVDGDTAVARILLPQGTPLEETERVVDQMVTALARLDVELSEASQNGEQASGWFALPSFDVSSWSIAKIIPEPLKFEFLGFEPKSDAVSSAYAKRLVQEIYARFYRNSHAYESGPHVVTVYADLRTAIERDTDLNELFERWEQSVGKVTNAIAVNYSDPGLGASGRAIKIRSRGEDLTQLRQVSLRIRDWLSRFDGVKNLVTDLRPGKREFLIRARPAALAAGLTSTMMAEQLRAAFQGAVAQEIQVDTESIEFAVRLQKSSQDAVGDLRSFRFTMPDGTQVPLVSVATIVEDQGWSRIGRIDRMRTATLRGDVNVKKGNTAAILGRFEKDFLPQLEKEFPEINFEIAGQQSEVATAGGSLIRGFLIAIAGVFILLSFQFRSYIEPLLVMSVIPFSMIGVVIGHLLLGYPLTMPSMLGFASLAGIVVNDSILLVLFLKQRRGEGDAAIDAARQASRDRFRAILITSLTTMAGLLPLTFETSPQAKILIPLAISIVFGLFASTALVLWVIPCLYLVLDDLGLTAPVESADEPEQHPGGPSADSPSRKWE